MVIILLDVTANAFDVFVIINHQKVRNLSFCPCVITLSWPDAWPRRISNSLISALKVRKTQDFFQNPVFFIAYTTLFSAQI